jgi:DNA repair protein SbcC/Rad50
MEELGCLVKWRMMMRITRISVDRLPGIDRRFEIETITPGLNIILGPNGAGKSSICRSIRQSLWPSVPSPRTRVRITWDDGGAELISDLETTVAWQRNGENVSAPEVAPGHLARCYTVTLPDLLEDNNPADGRLAEDIRILMAGGYNLPAVKEKFSLKKSQGRSEARTLADAERALERIQIERRGLSEDEDRLSSLQEELDIARTATRECNLLTIAMELTAKRRDLGILQAGIEGFPPGMDRLRGNERSRIQEIDEEIDELEESIAGKTREVEKANQELVENELPDGTVDEDIICIEDERVHRLEQLAREREGREEELKQSDVLLREAGTALGISAENNSLELGDLRLDDVDGWARKAIRLKDRRQSIEAKLATLMNPDKISREDVAKVRRGSDLLGDWLSSPGSTGSSGRNPVYLRFAAGLIVLTGAILAFLVNPWFILPSGLGLGIILMSFLSGESGGDQQELFRKQFEELELPPLSSWRKPEVRARLRDLRGELLQGEMALVEEAERGRLQGELLVLEDENRQIEDERLDICQSAGLDPATTELAIVDYIDRLKAYRGASRAVTAARSAALSSGKKHDESLKEVQDFLARVLGETPRDDLEASHLMKTLKERSGRLHNARFRLKTAQVEIADRYTEISKKQNRIELIFRQAGIELSERLDADPVLDDMLDRLDEYRKKKRQADGIQTGLNERESQLADRDDLLELEQSEVESRLDLARRQEKQRDDLVSRIQQIKDRIEAAVSGNALEDARALVERESDQLKDRYDETLAAAAGRLLLGKTEEEYEEKSRPAVLDRAARWFSAFTRARYELLVAGGQGSASFRARETSTGRGLGLDELSDGTRVQLLLATRLAFSTQAESGGAIPLFMDEALTTSDLDRFRAIAECLITIAGEGRQIFYLTSNPSDAEYFAAICRNVGAAEPNLIDLGRIRTLAAAESDIVKLAPPAPFRIPAPEGMTAIEYGACLEVPSFNPVEPFSVCHLFHILYDDLKLLYIIMLRSMVSTVGQWESFLRLNPAPSGVSPAEIDQINNRIELLRLFLEAWSIGRGKPVDREVLVKSGAVSERYLDAFSALALEMGNDSRLFIECLEVGDDPRTARFRKKQALRDYLEENEFIDTRERLNIEEITAIITARSENLTALSPEDIICQISGLWSRANRKGEESE